MLCNQIEQIHRNLNDTFPALCRIAVVLYDRDTDMLKTFTNSTRDATPIQYYSSKLSSSESLSKMVKTREMRIIDDITAISSDRRHTKLIKAAGYRSSLTFPIFSKDSLVGILFMNAKEVAYFTKARIEQLNIFIHLISTLLIAETMPLKTLKGAVATAREFSRIKDEETGAHLSRMSHYARVIALEIAEKHDLNDEMIEYIFQFSPLHDVGKVGVPDNIILKNGKLTADERSVVQTHVHIGKGIIDTMVDQFDLDGLDNVQMLRNIVLYHHECVDGSGYPEGLKGEEIPIEARITSTADVFDALTSKRPYKEAWTNRKALDFMAENKGIMFDADCVDALFASKPILKGIQERFREDKLG